MSHVDITGFDLTIDEIVRVAKEKARVALTPEAVERMKAARAIIDEAVARGEKVYGVTTSVGAKTGVPLAPERIGEFNRRLLLTHNVANGPLASPEAVRAMMLVLLNSMASGRLGVRPLLAEQLTEALNTDRQIDVHVWGSMGQSDMAPITDLALALYGDLDLQAGEALAMLNSSALALGISALAMAELRYSLDLWSLIAALSMEGFAANPSIVSEAALRSRHHAARPRSRHGRAGRSDRHRRCRRSGRSDRRPTGSSRNAEQARSRASPGQRRPRRRASRSAPPSQPPAPDARSGHVGQAR